MDNEEIQGVKFSEFPSATPGNSDEVVGLHSGDNARFSIANIVAAVRNGLASIFVPLTRTINGKALSTDITLDSSDIDYDNTGSGLTATDVQEAIDELAQGGGGGTTVIANPSGSATDTLTKLQVESTVYSVPSGGGGASEAQLAYVESGTTASRNYTAGQYIALNGLLYTADTAIASGATLYTSGGNKNLSECTGGGFNNLLSTVSALKVQEFAFTTSTLGTNFSQTSRAIGTTQNLFGIDATHICSIFIRDNTMTPSANMIFGIWGGTLYMAATQTCTLSDYLPVRIVVVYY